MSEDRGRNRFTVQPSLVKKLRKALRVVAMSNISRMAAALSYRTVFGLIPMIAIGVAVLGGFATDEQVTKTVDRVLELSGLKEIVVAPDTAGPPASPEAAATGKPEPGEPPTALDDWLKSLVAKVRSVSYVAIGFSGLLILAYAAISFMVEIERSANHIYRAPTGRSWVRRVTQYWTTLTLGSIFLVGTFYVGERAQDVLTHWAGGDQKQSQHERGGGSEGGQTGGTTPAGVEDGSEAQGASGGSSASEPAEGSGGAGTGEERTDGQDGDGAGETATVGALIAGKLVSLSIDFVLLFFVYTTVPNARVNMRCAAIGAVLAAVFWETGKWGFQIFVANSSTQTLYGAIALVPLFLMWVYITWIIVLGGLQISYVLQHFRSFELDDEHRGPLLIDPLALVRVTIEVARKFAGGERASVADVSKTVGLDEKTSLKMLERLSDARVLNRVPEGQEHEGFALARPAGEISATELLDLAGRMTETGDHSGESERFSRLRRAQRDAAAGITLADLMGERARQGPITGSSPPAGETASGAPQTP